MDEYIDKETLISSIESVDWYSVYRGKLTAGATSSKNALYKANDIYSAIDNVLAADVAPVRHGRWIESEDEYGMILTCSVCGEDFVSWEADCARTNYCPNCGSDMRGSDDER